MIETNQKREERKLKASLMQDHNMVDLMAASLARLFDEKVVFPKLFEIYPDVFTEEYAEEVRRREEEYQMQQEKLKWQNYVAQYNASLKKKGRETEEQQ